MAKELHKPVRTHFKKRQIITKGIDDLWAADLIDIKKFSKENPIFLRNKQHEHREHKFPKLLVNCASMCKVFRRTCRF